MGRVVGIDLGTTNSVVATLDFGMSTPHALKTHDDAYTLSSLVAWKDGHWVVGHRATENVAKMDSGSVIRSSKRFIGLNYNDPKVKEDISRLESLRIVPAPTSESGVRFAVGEQLISPVTVATHILRQLKSDAESVLGAPVTHAVITVPAYFDAAQIEATRRAGEAAGLIVQRVFPEPAAAALAYGSYLQQNLTGQRLLVFDLGGGTFDVTIGILARDAEGILFAADVIKGDNHLGGDDFDALVEDHVIQAVKSRHGVDLRPRLRESPSALGYYLHRACREAKEALSRDLETRLDVNEVFDQARVTGLPRVEPIVIKREEFESMIRPLMHRIRGLVEAALKEKELDQSDVDQVLLVGGSTLIPLVREQLRTYFGDDRVRIGLVDPMLVVGEGAAVVADSLPARILCPNCNSEQAVEVAFCTLCGTRLDSNLAKKAADMTRPQALSMEAVSTLPIPIGIATESGTFDILIPRGTTYSPTSGEPSEWFKRPYHIREDNQRYVLIECYEGEATRASENRYLGQFRAGPLPAGLHSGETFTIELGLNGDRLLTGRLICRDTMVKWQITRDSWIPDIVGVTDEARDLADKPGVDAATRARLINLADQADELVRSPDASPNKARLITIELQQETDAVRHVDRSPSGASTIGELRSILGYAQGICEYGETWIQLASQVPFPQLRTMLEADGRQLDALRSAREEGKRAEHLRDDFRARRCIDMVNGLLGSLRLVLTLAFGEMMSQWRPDSPRAGASNIRPLTADEYAAFQRNVPSDGKPSFRQPNLPTPEECINQLGVLIIQMRQTALTDEPRFRVQYERIRELIEAYFEQC